VHGQGFARIFATSTFAREPMEQTAAKQLGRRIVESGFAVLETAMPEEGYLVGGFSVADPILFYIAFWADKMEIPLPDRIARHYRLMLTRPAVQLVLREEGYNPAKLGGLDRHN
jgi:glutathione S-transferase